MKHQFNIKERLKTISHFQFVRVNMNENLIHLQF